MNEIWLILDRIVLTGSVSRPITVIIHATKSYWENIVKP